MPDWGASQVVSEPWFYDTPLVRSACRITLPTDESSVKTMLVKMRWIVLISSSFIPYLYSNSPLTFTCFDLFSYLLQVYLSRRWVSVVPLGCSFLLLLWCYDIWLSSHMLNLHLILSILALFCSIHCTSGCVENCMRRANIGEVGKLLEHVLFMPMKPLWNLLIIPFHWISSLSFRGYSRRQLHHLLQIKRRTCGTPSAPSEASRTSAAKISNLNSKS